MSCERCYERESTLECRTCAGQGEEPVKYCEECSKTVHFGRLGNHHLMSTEMKKKKEDLQTKIGEFSSLKEILEIRIEEFKIMIQNLNDKNWKAERSIKQMVQEAQQRIKLKAKDVIKQFKDTTSEKISKIQQCQNMCQEWIQNVSKVSLESAQFMEQHPFMSEEEESKMEEFKNSLVTFDSDVLVGNLPSLDLGLELKQEVVSHIMEAIDGLKAVEVHSETNCSDLKFDTEPPQEGDTMSVYVNSLLSKHGHFWVQPDFSKHAWNTLEKMCIAIRFAFIKHQDWQTYAQMDPEPPEVGQLCFARFSADNMWYRARVEELPVGKAKKGAMVRFVDFGNLEFVPYCFLLPYRDGVLPELPHQALECCLFSPSEEQEQLPTDARWYFGDRVKGEQLGCQIKEKVTADHSDVWVVNLYLNGEETSINETILKKIEENKQVKSEGIMCRDIRLLEKKEDEADGIVSIRHTVNGSADAVKDDDVDAEPSNTSIEQCQSEEVDSMPMLASIESNSDDNTAIQSAASATLDAENITTPSESAKEQELSQCASDLSEKAEDAEPPVSDLHVSNFDEEEEVSPVLPVDVAERPPISTVSDEPDVQESHMINIEEEEEKQLDIGESNSHNGAFVDKAFSQTDKMAATSENYPKLQNIQMVKDATFKLRVTSPLCVDGTFQVSLIYNQEIREEYDRFLEDMSSHAEHSQPVCDNVSMGQLVAVQYEDRWQRGMMKDHDVGQGYVQIQLVDDEGQVELINRETIRLLTDTYSLLAPQSVKCSISKEECPVFSHRARDTFKALVEGSELSAFVTKVVPNIQTYVQLYSGHVDITQQLYDAELSNVQENHTSPDSTNGVEVPHQQNNLMLYAEREPRPLLGAGQQNLPASAWLDAGAAPFIPAEQTGPHAPPGGHYPGPHLGPHPGPLHPGAHLTRLPFHLPPPNMNHNMPHNFPTLLEQGLHMQQLQLSAHDSRESGAPRFRSPPQIYRGDEGSAHRSPPQQNTERFPSDNRGGVVTQAREGNPAHGDQYQEMPDRCYTTPPANWHRDRNLHNTTRGQGDHQQDGGDGYDDSVWDEDNMPSFPFDLNSSPSSVTSDLGPRALMPGHPEHVPRSRDLESRDLSNFRCFGCHKLGHVQRNCPLKRSAGFHKYKSKGKRH